METEHTIYYNDGTVSKISEKNYHYNIFHENEKINELKSNENFLIKEKVFKISWSKKMTDAELDELFTYQNPSNIDPCRFDEIRLQAKKLAWTINENGGWSEDKKRAIMKLREAVFYAIASIVFEDKDDKLPY